VFITGHSGFKGTWLTAWLVQEGADVVGYSLNPDTDPSNVLHSTALTQHVDSRFGDIRNECEIAEAIRGAKPDVVLHLAAQPLVRSSYEDPVGTFATNVLGTVHVLEACRKSESVRAVVSVASDKCYENLETGQRYRETDPLGGADPYSASKGAAEIVTASYRASFFAQDGPLLASVRAGNVVGAGDESTDRLVPDIVRALRTNKSIVLRRPEAVRPWQHVLEPVRAYLMLATALYSGDQTKASAWNIGPQKGNSKTVEQLTRALVARWGTDIPIIVEHDAGRAESGVLRLDTRKAENELGFVPWLGFDDTIRYVVDGYRALDEGSNLTDVIRSQTVAYASLG